jgi:hypothetical protein
MNPTWKKYPDKTGLYLRAIPDPWQVRGYEHIEAQGRNIEAQGRSDSFINLNGHMIRIEKFSATDPVWWYGPIDFPGRQATTSK